MGTARTFGTPPRAASLTDIGPRGRSPVRIDGRKQGDLTNPVRPASGTAVTPEILGPAQVRSAVGRSDVFDFNNLEGLGVEIDADAVEISELAHRPSAAPPLFHPDEGSDEGSHEPGILEVIPLGSGIAADAVTVGAGSSATEWCLAERSHSECTVSAAGPETPPLRADPADAVADIESLGGRGRGTQAQARSPVSQITALALGTLLVVAGVALVVASMWPDAPLQSPSMASGAVRIDATGLERYRAMLPVDGRWLGLAFVLVGAALDAIGLRARRAAFRT